MNAIKTLGAAFFAVGLVCAQLALAGCGAPPEAGEEIGQTGEPLLVFGLQNARTFGSAPSVACTTGVSSTAECNWLHPYEVHPYGLSVPSRYSATINPSDAWPSGHKAAIQAVLTNTVLPMFNGELAPFFRAWDQSGIGGQLHIGFSIKSPHPAVGDTNLLHYITPGWSNCQASYRTESPAEQGKYRSCGQLNYYIDTAALSANFPAARFTGNLNIAVAFALDLAEGVGQQSSQVGFTQGILSVTQASGTAPFTAQEKRQVETAFIDNGPSDTNISFSN